MKKLAIISTHPVQYNAPWFQLLAEKVTLKVFYTWGQSHKGSTYDPDFQQEIQWDIPLLTGYEYYFVPNTARRPGSHHFRGIINPTLNKSVEEWNPDALLILGWGVASHFRSLRYFHGKVPILFRGDSTLLDEKLGLRKIMRRIFLTWLYRHIDYALYTGTHNKDYFLAHGVKQKQLIYAPHAIDNSRFEEPDDVYRQQAADWRKELGIADNELVILFAGKLEPKKNPFFLLELAKRLEGKPVKFVLVGNGRLEKSLREAAKADPRILFVDFQNQSKMPIVYRIADIFILSSRGPGETWGLGANEAMASGCVVMLSDMVGSAVDLVEQDRTGIIFGVDDLALSTRFIEDLLENNEKLKRMKLYSKDRIKHFNYSGILDAVLKALNTTWGNKPKME